MYHNGAAPVSPSALSSRPALLLTTLIAAGSSCDHPTPVAADAGAEADAAAPPSAVASAEPPPPPPAPPPPPPPSPLHCPRAMISVADRFCIDKWETSLLDKATRTPLSPYFPPDRR